MMQLVYNIFSTLCVGYYISQRCLSIFIYWCIETDRVVY